MSQSINNDGGTLSVHLQNLSIDSTVPSAKSMPLHTQQRSMQQGHPVPASHPPPSQSTNPTLKRFPSSSSIAASRSSPTSSLHRKPSLNSLKGASAGTPPSSPAARRASSYLPSSPSTTNARPNLIPPPEEPQLPQITASIVAKDFLERDLATNHASLETKLESQTVVILQDDCYGHRYSRPRTSKAGLSTIVERPERIHASLLGLSTAYVRLGGRHAHGAAAPHPERQPASLPPAPFKIHKTARRLSLQSLAAATVHGDRWMAELSAMCDSAESRLATGGKELARPQESTTPDGSRSKVRPGLHEGDLYLCSGSLDALQGALGGVCEAVDLVFNESDTKRSFVCIRPPGHHCSADMPSGFCWLNNVHVGIGHAAITHGLTHAAIIDFDLHHGDGSQSIAWDHNARIASLPKNTPISKKTSIGYFSLHDINSYPCEMGDEEKVRNASLCIENAHGQSIWNVHLQSWKTEADFWTLYEDRYLVLLAKARAFLRDHSDKLRQAPTHPKPRGAIFLSAGFDASEWETSHMQRHQVNVPTGFYARFTRDVVALAEEEDLGVEGRIISVLEGGYSDRALMSGVLSHISGLSASTAFSNTSSYAHGFGLDVSRRLGQLAIDEAVQDGHQDASTISHSHVDPDWWSLPCLEQIEALAHPPPPTAQVKKQRSDVKPTYFSATESYKAKVVPPAPGRRSVSGSSIGNIPFAKEMPANILPPPEVEWTTAAYELSKLLIPSDRDTKSCKPEDLNAEATRARRDRQSGVGVACEPLHADLNRMQLREKRVKQPKPDTPSDLKIPTRSSRRKTVADVKLLPLETDDSSPVSESAATDQPRKPTRRRSSAASSVTSYGTDIVSGGPMGAIAESQTGENSHAAKEGKNPSNPRAITAKSRAPKRPTTGTRTASSSSTASQSYKATTQQPFPFAEYETPLSTNEDLKNQDVNQLSSGMRQMSIKLNVPPREEYEARQAKAKPPPRGRPPKVPSSSGTTKRSPTKTKPKASPPPKSKKKAATSGLPPVPTSHDTTDVLRGPQDISQLVEVRHNKSSDTRSQEVISTTIEQLLPREQPSASQPSQSLVEAGSPGPMPRPMIQSGPEQGEPQGQLPSGMPISSPAPVLSLPSTPTTVKRTKQNLPVFTSTSSISFGSNAPALHPEGIDSLVAEDHESSIKMEESSNKTGSLPMQNPPGSNYHGIIGGGQEQLDQQLQFGREGRGDSIWDIPETPQPRRT